MATAAKATAQAFLADMLLIFPILGINAFTPPKQNGLQDQLPAMGLQHDQFDTIVVPARKEGSNNVSCMKTANLPFASTPSTSQNKFQRRLSGNSCGCNQGHRALPRQRQIHDRIQRPGDLDCYRPAHQNDEVSMQALRQKLLAAKHLDAIWT